MSAVMKRTFILANEQVRKRAALFVVNEAPDGWAVTAKEPTRTLEQNAAQWPILEAFSKQLKWPVNGQLVTLSPEEWKDILTAAFQGERVRLAMGLNGGVVMLGLRTSTMPKPMFSEYLEFLHATASDRGVVIYNEAKQ